MIKRTFQHVYGPVPSRRLGRSLGVDLVPFKTCTYDCVYCQLGDTTNKTLERKEYASIDKVLDELKEKLTCGSTPDYIGLAGSGEPAVGPSANIKYPLLSSPLAMVMPVCPVSLIMMLSALA